MKHGYKQFVIIDESLKIVYKGSENKKRLRLNECIINIQRRKRENMIDDVMK